MNSQKRWLPVVMLAAVMLLGACTDGGRIAEDYPDLYNTLSDTLEDIRIVNILVGLVLLIGGWKFYRVIVALPGMVLGAIVGATALQSDDQPFFALAGFIGGGAIGGVLAGYLHDFLIWTLGAILGTVFFESFIVTFMDSTPPSWLLVVLGIATGIVFVAIYDRFRFLVAAAIGAMLLGAGLAVDAGLVLVFFVVSLFVQFTLARAMGESIFTRRDLDKHDRD